MQGKIALEEHFAIEETLQDSNGWNDAVWAELKPRLMEMPDRWLREMDAQGIQMMLPSLNAPAVQAIPSHEKAIAVSRKANDFLAEQVVRNPDRFQGLGALPMQDPDAAIDELNRCVKDLGFVGVLVNGFSESEKQPDTALYYDLPQYRDFWAELEKLDVPLYLHPRNPLPGHAKIFDGHPWLMGPTWAFAHETGTHALRLMASGIFDTHPGLRIVLGHLGEHLPYAIWRADNRNAWTELPPAYPAKRLLGDYLRENFYITTSGNYRTQSLVDAISEVGSDHVMFSVDWPFENVNHAAPWFDTCEISEADRQKIGRDNAIKLFKLDQKGL